MSNPNIAYIAASFMEQFHSRHMILFVGKGISEDTINEHITKLPWSCVVTSRTDGSFGNSFLGTGRIVREWLRPSEVPSRPLNKQGELSILRIMGMNEPLDEDEVEIIELTGQTEEEYRLEKARDMLRTVLGLLDGTNIMVVLGYNPSVEGELPYPLFAQLLNNSSVHAKNVQFWGLDSNDPKVEKLKTFAERKGFTWQTNTLESVVLFWYGEGATSPETVALPGNKDEIFYKGGQAVGISPKTLLQYRHFASLLTDQTLNAIRPYGRIQQARWYYNFLTLSATEGPQWYGYLRNSEFYVRRDFEDVLVNLTRKLLSGNAPRKEETNTPIILYGAPASSKSISLGALAYRIYNEHINPVIYIKDDTLLFTGDSSETEELFRLMEQIDKIGPDMRILLIWDCSSYRNVANNAQRLAKILFDRGRRFVLVCSAYDDPNPKEEHRVYYSYNRNEHGISFAEGNASKCHMFFCNGCYYIPAERKLSPNEQHCLFQKFEEFSGAPNDHIKNIRAKIYETSDIFEIFYKIISVLRPNLEQSLTREEAKVNDYVVEQLSLIDASPIASKPSINGIAQAFLNANIDLKAFGIDLKDFEDRAASVAREDYDLHRFNTCVALFSRFKIEVSYSLAMQMLKPKDTYLDDFSVDYDPALFDLMTTRIPWLRYGLSKNGNDYAFSFRNALEAELFLTRNKVDGKQQVDLLCDMLEVFGAYYQKYHYLLDTTLASNLQHLIRLMGPNSQYPPFRTDKLYEHKDILRNLECIIELLEDLCVNQQLPDPDAGFATILTTFSREYYGKKWNSIYGPDSLSAYTPEKYLYRISKLNSTLEYARKKIDDLEFMIKDLRSGSEKKHYSDQRNGLVVELTYCDILLKKLQREYCDKCNKLGVSVSAESVSFCSLSYREVYSLLYHVILNNPSNGHAYNALFSSFEEMYEHSSYSEPQKLQYLSEIKLIADDCGSIDIKSRGADERDEIREHLQKISQYSNRYKISIDDIHNGTVNPAFNILYQNMIEANSPAAVTFVCQQELEKADIDYTTTYLSNYQLTICNKVMHFMQEDINATCVAGNYYAQNLLLRVTWMYYTGSALKDSPECQLIKLSYEKWEHIKTISSHCIACANQKATGKVKPLIVLVNALATLQTTNDYHKCVRIINSLNEDQFYFSPRMKVPFMICNETEPVTYDGYVAEINGMNGRIILANVPSPLAGKAGIRFHLSNLGLQAKRIAKGQRLDGLELGLGYTGFSVYSTSGREFRGGQL